jgi:hypothetical protein
MARSANDDLLSCLEDDAEINISQCTELSQTVKMVCKKLKAHELEAQILFTNIEDLQDDAKHDQIRIDALKIQHKNLRAMYEAKLQAQKDKYDELFQQFENLRTRCTHMEKRERETLNESCRRIKEWMSGKDA